MKVFSNSKSGEVDIPQPRNNVNISTIRFEIQQKFDRIFIILYDGSWNAGTSITNGIEYITAFIYEQFPQISEYVKDQIFWFENYEHSPNIFDQVSFYTEPPLFATPSWNRLSKEQLLKKFNQLM